MLVHELMNKNVIAISPMETSSFASRLLSRCNVGALPVCADGGRLRGIITDRDIVLRCIAAERDPAFTPVGEIMSKRVFSVSPDDDVREASRLMAEMQIRRLPVTDEGKLVGIISIGDLAKCGRFEMEASKALSEISSNVHRL